MEGSSFIGKGERWYKLEVDVSDVDFENFIQEWEIDPSSVPTLMKYFTLSLLAQQLLAYRVYEAGGYSADEYKFVADTVKKKFASLKTALQKESGTEIK